MLNAALWSLTVGCVAYTVVCLVMLECIREVVNPLYHCRRSARNRQYKHDRSIIIISIAMVQKPVAKSLSYPCDFSR